MRYQRRSLRTFLISLAICLLAAVACAPDPQRVVTVLVDFSASGKRRIPEYARFVADTVLRALGPADKLIVLPIDDGSVQTPTHVFDLDLSALSFTRRSDGVAHADEAEQTRRRSYVDSLRATVRDAIVQAAVSRRSLNQQTDIIGAIEHAMQLRESMRRPHTGPLTRARATILGDRLFDVTHVLVLASDMLQEAGGLDFAHAAPKSQRSVEAFVTRLRADGRIPDLTGVDVIVFGATGASAEQVASVRDFWLLYFQTAKARVVTYDFDASAATFAYLRDSQSEK